MSLLTNLVTQIVTNALQNKMGGHMPHAANPQDSMGGLGSILGGMLGGAQTGSTSSGVNLNNGFGLDDIIGMAMNQNQSSTAMPQGGVLGQVLGNVLGGGMGMNSSSSSQGGLGGKGMLMAALLPIALMFIQRNGGLSGALNKIQNMGFGQQANSWMSATQSNQPLDPNAISQLFDNNELAQVAAQTGVDQNVVREGLAQLLPQVFDNLTPQGDTQTEHQANDEISQILSQLSQFKG